MKKDYYFRLAREEGKISRAYYKLSSIWKKHRFYGRRILELGASPGGWTTFLLEQFKKSIIMGIDLIDTKIKSPRYSFVKGDIMDYSPTGEFDLLCSDLSPNLSGIQALDSETFKNLHTRIYEIINSVLCIGGRAIIKVFQDRNFKENIKRYMDIFEEYQFYKPPASRKTSSEIYIILNKKI